MVGVWDSYINAASNRFGVPPQFVRAVIATESGGRHNAVSRRGAGGLMQIMEPTYAELAKRHGLGPDRFNPEDNINAGTAYLGQLHKQFGNWDDAFAAYNAGPNRWRRVKAGSQPAPAETVAYVPKVKAGIGPDMETPTMPTGNFGDVLKRITTPGWTGGPSEEDLLEQTRTGSLPRPMPQMPQMPPGLLGGGAGRTDELINRLGGLLGDGTTPGPQVPADAPWYERMAAGMAQPGAFQHVMGGIAGALAPMAGWQRTPVTNAQVLAGLAGGMQQGAQGWRQQQLGERDRQMGDVQSLIKLEQLRTKQQTDRQALQATYQYADQLERAGHTDLAQAVRGNPALMDEVVKAQAGQTFQKNPDQTAAVKNALALGYAPGTPEFREAVKLFAGPQSTNINLNSENNVAQGLGDMRVKQYTALREKGEAAPKMLAKLDQLESVLAELGSTGPATPTISKLVGWAQQAGVPTDMIGNFYKSFTGLNLADPATVDVANKLVNDFVTTSIKALGANPTDTDLATLQAAFPSVTNQAEANRFIIRNTLRPQFETERDLWNAVRGLDRTDPTLGSLEDRIYQFQQQKTQPRTNDATPNPSTPQAAGSAEKPLPPPQERYPNARQAPDGNWYIPDPDRPGKYLRIKP